MKHQIQLYTEADLEADRTVVAEREGQTNETELNAWYATESAKVTVPTGQLLSIVPDNHPWFIFSEEVIQTPVAMSAPSNDVTPMEGEPLEFAALAAQVLAKNKEDRMAKHEADLKVRSALAGLNIS